MYLTAANKIQAAAANNPAGIAIRGKLWRGGENELSFASLIAKHSTRFAGAATNTPCGRFSSKTSSK